MESSVALWTVVHSSKKMASISVLDPLEKKFRHLKGIFFCGGDGGLLESLATLQIFNVYF